MKRPDQTKTPPRGIGGAGEAAEQGKLKAKAAMIGATDPACICRNGATCIVCLRWSRRIRGIDARRADSLRRQSIGQAGRAGG